VVMYIRLAEYYSSKAMIDTNKKYVFLLKLKSNLQIIYKTFTGLITISIIVGAILGITHRNNKSSYQTVDTPINLSISQLNKHQGEAYLVLRRTGCKHFEQMESTIVSRVKQLRKQGKTEYVLDL